MTARFSVEFDKTHAVTDRAYRNPMVSISPLHTASNHTASNREKNVVRLAVSCNDGDRAVPADII
jgi:hypothetical protein